MKQEKIKYDFKAFGQAIKEARKVKGLSRNELADQMNIAPRYIASIENSGQHPSLQIFYELVTLLDVSVDQFFFPNKETDKSTQRRQLESLLEDMSDKGLRIVTATAKEIKQVEQCFARNIALDNLYFQLLEFALVTYRNNFGIITVGMHLRELIARFRADILVTYINMAKCQRHSLVLVMILGT